MIKATAIGFTCFLIFLVLHVAVFRSIRLRERFRALTVLFYCLIPVYAVLYAALPSPYVVNLVPAGPGAPFMAVETFYRATLAVNFLGGLALYVFLFLGYCQFYFIVDRSISVRVMIEIENSPGKALSFDEIKRAYSFNGILTRRLEHMVEGRYLMKDPSGMYSNTPKGRAEARLFAFLKDLLMLGPGG
jgi:hypothetical protein